VAGEGVEVVPAKLWEREGALELARFWRGEALGPLLLVACAGDALAGLACDSLTAELGELPIPVD